MSTSSNMQRTTICFQPVGCCIVEVTLLSQLCCVHNDLVRAINEQCITGLITLDLSAMFDIVDHSILLSMLEKRFGICEITLAWFRSYLSDQTQTFLINGISSDQLALSYFVPQAVLPPAMTCRCPMAEDRPCTVYLLRKPAMSKQPSRTRATATSVTRCCIYLFRQQRILDCVSKDAHNFFHYAQIYIALRQVDPLIAYRGSHVKFVIYYYFNFSSACLLT